MNPSTVSGCIVTYNNMDTIDSAVSSLLEHTKLPFRLYAVDNGSADSTPEHLRSNYPDVEVIETGANLGFGAGHNALLCRLDSDYHVIINPDIFVRDDVIGAMVKYMDENPDIGLLSPQIRFPDGTAQVLGKRNPTLVYLFSSRLRNFSFCQKKLREYAMLDCDLSAPADIENASGCFMLIRTSLFKEIGGFDSRYFMYFEDCDLTREVRRRGKRAVYFPLATVYHEWHRDSKKSKKLRMIHINSMIRYFNKWGWK